jgi:predicted acyltransferase
MERNQSLDALRGFAILTMVLSGSIAFGGVLPAWMYHAQVPPPLHKFIPTVPGITWVDLVFPFFLFSMGATIPLSLAKLEREGGSFWVVVWIALRRYLLLTFFALFTYHMRAWVIAETPTAKEYLLSILAFVLLCFQFYEYKAERYKLLFTITRVAAFAIGLFLLYYLPFNKGKGFLFDKVDIIILVLGNMAFFGTIIWWLTRKNVLLRFGLLAFVMAGFLAGNEKGSWINALVNYSPIPWMYKFYYLKYLFIIIPGTIAGEWLRKSDVSSRANPVNQSKYVLLLITILTFGIVWGNVALLFSRLLFLNLCSTIVVSLTIYYLLKKYLQNEILQKFWSAGFYLLLLGLAFEAYEGGIKKDPSTYSYYFVTSGLAFFMLIGFYGLQLIKPGTAITNYLRLNGRNPMVAYVAGNLLLTPLMHLTGVIDVFNNMNTSPWIGFLRGILFTGIVSLITIFFTKRKWFWKT